MQATTTQRLESKVRSLMFLKRAPKQPASRSATKSMPVMATEIREEEIEKHQPHGLADGAILLKAQRAELAERAAADRQSLPKWNYQAYFDKQSQVRDSLHSQSSQAEAEMKRHQMEIHARRHADSQRDEQGYKSNESDDLYGRQYDDLQERDMMYEGPQYDHHYDERQNPRHEDQIVPIETSATAQAGPRDTFVFGKELDDLMAALDKGNSENGQENISHVLAELRDGSVPEDGQVHHHPQRKYSGPELVQNLPVPGLRFNGNQSEAQKPPLVEFAAQTSGDAERPTVAVSHGVQHEGQERGHSDDPESGESGHRALASMVKNSRVSRLLFKPKDDYKDNVFRRPSIISRRPSSGGESQRSPVKRIFDKIANRQNDEELKQESTNEVQEEIVTPLVPTVTATSSHHTRASLSSVRNSDNSIQEPPESMIDPQARPEPGETQKYQKQQQIEEHNAPLLSPESPESPLSPLTPITPLFAESVRDIKPEPDKLAAPTNAPRQRPISSTLLRIRNTHPMAEARKLKRFTVAKFHRETEETHEPLSHDIAVDVPHVSDELTQEIQHEVPYLMPHHSNGAESRTSEYQSHQHYHDSQVSLEPCVICPYRLPPPTPMSPFSLDFNAWQKVPYNDLYRHSLLSMTRQRHSWGSGAIRQIDV